MCLSNLRGSMIWFSLPIPLMSDSISHNPGAVCLHCPVCLQCRLLGHAVSTSWNSLFWKALGLASFLRVSVQMPHHQRSVPITPQIKEQPRSPSISHHPLSTWFSIASIGMWRITRLLILFIIPLSLFLSS